MKNLKVLLILYSKGLVAVPRVIRPRVEAQSLVSTCIKQTASTQPSLYTHYCDSSFLAPGTFNASVMTATTEIAETEISTATNPAPSKLLPILSGSTSPFLPGETPPLDMPAQENTMDGEKSDVEYAEKPASLVGATSEAAKVELPPSPSLTRQASHDSENFVTKQTAEALDEKDVDVEPEEVDRTDWHPMDHTRSDSKDLNTTQETTFVDDTLSHEVDEKYLPAPAPRNVASNPSLRIIAKPPSPQPWDLVDPPTSNNGDATDYYSTLGTKNFGTLQKNMYVWPIQPTQFVFDLVCSRSDIPHSTYYFGPPPADSAYGSTPVGRIGVHHPREVFRVERDYTGGELVQFTSTYPLELEGRVRYLFRSPYTPSCLLN